MIVTRRKRVPGPQYDPAQIIGKQLGQMGPTRHPLNRIKQARVFLRAKLNGAPTKDANLVAGFPPTRPLSLTMGDPIIQPMLVEMLKEEEFKDSGIVKRLKEMWHHKRIRYQKVGDEIATVHEDDTDMWKYAMDRVLNLKGYLKQSKEHDNVSGEATGGIVFNVLQISK